MRPLFILFIVMPIIEMLILIKVGSFIGAWYTIGLVLLTAIIGVNLLKQQGLRTLLRAQQKAQMGALPVSEIGEGLLLAVAGALLLTPGFVTDAIGFTLLSPGVRRAMAASIATRLVDTSLQGHSANRYESTHNEYVRTESGRASDSHPGDVIDGEFEELDDKNPPKKS